MTGLLQAIWIIGGIITGIFTWKILSRELFNGHWDDETVFESLFEIAAQIFMTVCLAGLWFVFVPLGGAAYLVYRSRKNRSVT